MIALKQSSAFAPFRYSMKMRALRDMGRKTYKPFRRALKVHLDDSMEKVF